MKINNQKSKLRILILISGSIAAVRIPLLVSQLIQDNHEVKCVLTNNAKKIINPLSLSVLSRNTCFLDEDQWSYKNSSPLHINLCDWANIVIIAPLTATTLSKWVTGNAEGLVSSILIANNHPIIVAPAMNSSMWANPSVQENYKQLKKYPNVLCLEPSYGLLACDQIGLGKMSPNDLIALAIKYILVQDQAQLNDLSNKKFLITGGSTSESIDPARRFTNNSSGTMGMLLAQTARFRGADVTYIHGPLKINRDLVDGIKTIEIETGLDLEIAIKKEIINCDYFFMNSAVTDVKLSQTNQSKISKNNLVNYFANNLELVPDILKNVVQSKRESQVFMGFCAYTGDLDNLRRTIKNKFKVKGCEMIFANPIDIDGQGFGQDVKNEGWLFDTNGKELHIDKTSKIDLANQLINQIISITK